ncbi:hypothetical protein BKM31_12685 [[Actinomadura] parvosata subsp. kistnae]|uniref:Uncharacterized protein n=1 Tax=[Actinomadura] parvosata subsp. kistnae TaxID=1909395 RepID=A0A1U9ZW90_9ACTN|nr:hypothetical protein BKM31_12685 [Nonomuraea sp. ATCC 55076]
MRRLMAPAYGLAALLWVAAAIALWTSERNDLRAAAVMLTVALASFGVGLVTVRRDDRRRVSAFLGTSAISMLVLGWGVAAMAAALLLPWFLVIVAFLAGLSVIAVFGLGLVGLKNGRWWGVLLCCIPLGGVAYLSHLRPNEGVFWGALEVWSLVIAIALAFSFAWERRRESNERG